MPQNFVACDREQALLLPPSLREWLPEDHLVWLVLEAVGESSGPRFIGRIARTGIVARRWIRR